MPLPSGVAITVGGVDITSSVMPALTKFGTQFNAQPGICEIAVSDKAQVHDFTTGDEIGLALDGVELWGGYVTGITRRFAFPVVDTVNRAASAVKERQWVLRGVDFNTLWDKRVLRNPADYLHHLPNFPRTTFDGALIREAFTDSKYFDIEPEFDVTTEVDDVVRPFDPENESIAGDGAWIQQGSTARAFMEDLAQFSGAVYYFGPDKKLYHKALEDSVARWGFSDVPNNDAITSDPGYQDVTIGFREGEFSEDGGPSTMVNDALIWGGSEWAGSGQTVFARETDEISVGDHGRWQHPEVHFGETGYKLQSGVDARANVIVNGAPGSVGGDAGRGLRFPQPSVSLTWFAHRIPRLAGVPDFLRAGQLVHIDLHTFGNGGVAREYLLPLRGLDITFPNQPSENNSPENPKTWVQFRGSFGLQLSDPYTLWRYLLGQRNAGDRPRQIASVDGSNPAPYGALLSVAPSPSPDGSTTLFDLPDDRGYISGTTEVYVDGLRLRLGVDYTESDPNEGEITLAVAPSGSSWIWVICRVTGA